MSADFLSPLTQIIHHWLERLNNRWDYRTVRISLTPHKYAIILLPHPQWISLSIIPTSGHFLKKFSCSNISPCQSKTESDRHVSDDSSCWCSSNCERNYWRVFVSLPNVSVRFYEQRKWTTISYSKHESPINLFYSCCLFLHPIDLVDITDSDFLVCMLSYYFSI